MKEMSSLDIYRLFVRSVIRTNGIQRISNDSPAHAIVLLGELIRSATSSVDVYCHRLASDVWGAAEIREAVLSAREKKTVRFRVVVQEKSDDEIDASAFSFMKDSIRSFQSENMMANFLVVDDKAFRFEPDYRTRTGFAYVNNLDMSGALVNAFESIYQRAI